MDKWKIIKKEIKNLSISAIIIENDAHETKRISLEDAITLARNDKLENAKARLNTVYGEYILDVDGGLESLESIYDNKGLNLTIICRMINSDNKCIGYKVKDDTGKTYKLSLNKIWDLASNKSINGIKAVINGDKKCIISTEDYKLSDLPVISI